MKTLYKKIIVVLCLVVIVGQAKAQNFTVILGRPTNNSVTASLMFDQNVQFYLEYGTTSGNYTGNTTVYNGTMNITDEVDMTGLLPDTRYYYRVRYQATGAGSYAASSEYKFHTQRAPGSTFTFTVEADEHLYDKKGVQSIYRQTLDHEAQDNPDFMLSLGDIFGDDHYPTTITPFQLDSLHEAYRPFLGQVCHSIPFYVCLGNHEGENDYYYNQTPPNNLCIWATQSRKTYYPNPYPNSFYSGNTAVEPYGIGNPENYYAWEWGDALFIVLDPYWNKPVAPELSGDWNLTLGKEQYDWLRKTLETSKAKWKFVFSHNLIGGLDMKGTMRGGIEAAKYLEWGGYNLDGTYGFDKARPGWGKPIHQLLVDNKVTIFFHGHDHTYAKQDLDGIVYQAGPQPSASDTDLGNRGQLYHYDNGTVVGGTGYIRVRVSPTEVKADYVQTWTPSKEKANPKVKNGMVADTYSIKAVK